MYSTTPRLPTYLLTDLAGWLIWLLWLFSKLELLHVLDVNLLACWLSGIAFCPVVDSDLFHIPYLPTLGFHSRIHTRPAGQRLLFTLCHLT